MVENILPADPPHPDRQDEVNRSKFFQNMVMLHSKFKRITIAAERYTTFCLHTPLPGSWSIGQNSTFSEQGHVAYQIKLF